MLVVLEAAGKCNNFGKERSESVRIVKSSGVGALKYKKAREGWSENERWERREGEAKVLLDL